MKDNKTITLILGILAVIYLGIILTNLDLGSGVSPCYGTRVVQGIGLCNDVSQAACIDLAYYQVDGGISSQCYWNSATNKCSYKPSQCMITQPTTTTQHTTTTTMTTTTLTTSTTMPYQTPGNQQFITMTVLVAALVCLMIFIAKEQQKK
jgi:hypothetical protein